MTHRSTTQAAAVLDALRAQRGFSSAQEVYAWLRIQGHKIGLSTVYRHLQLLAERGVADAVHRPAGEATYRFCEDPSSGHHYHLVCRRCGRAERLEGRALERWADDAADRFGYRDVEHIVELFGTCSDCAKARPRNEPASSTD